MCDGPMTDSKSTSAQVSHRCECLNKMLELVQVLKTESGEFVVTQADFLKTMQMLPETDLRFFVSAIADKLREDGFRHKH